MTNFLPLKNCVLTAAEETSCVVQPVRHCRVCLLQTSGRVVGVAFLACIVTKYFCYQKSRPVLYYKRCLCTDLVRNG